MSFNVLFPVRNRERSERLIAERSAEADIRNGEHVLFCLARVVGQQNVSNAGGIVSDLQIKVRLLKATSVYPKA